MNLKSKFKSIFSSSKLNEELKDENNMEESKASSSDPFNTIVLCPVCLQPSLEFVHEFTSGWATTPRRYCRNCNYSGILVFEVDKKEYFSIPEEEREEFLKKWREEAFSNEEEVEEE